MMQQNQQMQIQNQQQMQMLMGQAPPNQSMSGGSIFRETREVLLPLNQGPGNSQPPTSNNQLRLQNMDEFGWTQNEMVMMITNYF